MNVPTEFTFSWRVGENTETPAMIYFHANDDICGEGYEGYDYQIIFDNPKFNTWLWEFEGVRIDSADGIKNDAYNTYEEICTFIAAVQS